MILASPLLIWCAYIHLRSGGSGAAFSFSVLPRNEGRRSADDNSADGKVAVKVSWKRSRDSVLNECDILHSLEGVPHVERCLGRPLRYPYDGDDRVMIVLSPVVTSRSADRVTSSLKKVVRGEPLERSVRDVVETMVGMLRMGVYTIDVQPLVDAETGNVVFVDFTEAGRFLGDPLSPSDASAIVGFCSEMLALVPDGMRDFASRCLASELRDDPLPGAVVDVLEGVWLD